MNGCFLREAPFIDRIVEKRAKSGEINNIQTQFYKFKYNLFVFFLVERNELKRSSQNKVLQKYVLQHNRSICLSMIEEIEFI